MLSKINHPFILLFSTYLCLSGFALKAQLTYNVLFLGNSYTGVNNLPQIVHDVALSAGDTLVFDSNTPGGYQLVDHYLDVISQNKIMTGGWDYVVLQGQSQEPITSYSQFLNGGLALYNLMKQSNPCAVAMPYMTWGRKNGDATNCAAIPVMCTYEGMDSTLRNAYLNFTNYIGAEVSPVSVVWNYLRQNHPGIELYQSDESHPSPAGSYAAACSFYASIFKKDPALTSYNYTLNATDAAIIRNAAKSQVFDNLHLWDLKKMPIADFTYQLAAGVNEVTFYPNQSVRQNYYWDFGDGDTSTLLIPTHSYLNNGTYTITLTTTNCDLQGNHTSTADTSIQFCSHAPTVYTSNPWLCTYDTLRTQAADFYQWYIYGDPLPETGQYIVNYAQYGSTGFAVLSTLNGCSELSAIYAEWPEWSGYYFDAMGDPCNGDTVKFAVLHTNGFLNGSETILWYKNDTLLPFNNEDTLYISGEGIYKCQVLNPNWQCPLDTTSYTIVYDCSVTGIDKNADELLTFYPNPATESITVNFNRQDIKGTIDIYTATGHLILSENISSPQSTINIDELPDGIYYLRLRKHASSKKLIKLSEH